MSVDGPRVCAPLSKIMAQGGDEQDRLLVTTEDVEGKRIHFSIDGSSDRLGHVNNPPVLTSALCEGLIVHVDDPDGRSVTLSVYLDPTSGQEP